MYSKSSAASPSSAELMKENDTETTPSAAPMMKKKKSNLADSSTSKVHVGTTKTSSQKKGLELATTTDGDPQQHFSKVLLETPTKSYITNNNTVSSTTATTTTRDNLTGALRLRVKSLERQVQSHRQESRDLNSQLMSQRIDFQQEMTLERQRNDDLRKSLFKATEELELL